MANDLAAGFLGAAGHLKTNVYKPLMIFNIMNSITIMTGGWTNFRRTVEGAKPNLRKMKGDVARSLMLVNRLPRLSVMTIPGIAHYAMDNDLTLREAALKLGRVTPEESAGW